ncbi:hypothetical protein IB277_36305 [Ensifer sp. ENS07]|nr:hypothetical protein [Ensifer sp. ENS07]
MEIGPSDDNGPDVDQIAISASTGEGNILDEVAFGSAVVPASEADHPTTVVSKKSKRKGPPRRGRDVVSRSIVAGSAPEIIPDELAALEEENRRLKGLLADRLRQENIQLRAMLKRFGAN